MRKTATRFLMVLAGACAWTGALSAQTYSVQFRVPFAFHTAHRALEPGDYVVAQPANLNIQTIRCVSRGPLLAIQPGGMNLSGGGNARVVFHRYGENYYLAQIWDGEGDGVNLAVSKEEKTVREIFAAAKQDTVTILAALH